LTYVDFSRILAIEQLFVGQVYSLDRFINKISMGVKVKIRLEEDDEDCMKKQKDYICFMKKQKDFMICIDLNFIDYVFYCF
jgi:hypothetical protein